VARGVFTIALVSDFVVCARDYGCDARGRQEVRRPEPVSRTGSKIPKILKILNIRGCRGADTIGDTRSSGHE